MLFTENKVFSITEEGIKGCILSFLKKDDLGIPKNYSGLTLITIVARTYNVLFLNHIKFEVKNVLRKNQNNF